MNEAETRAERIDPRLQAGGWGVVEGSQDIARVPYHRRPDRRPVSQQHVTLTNPIAWDNRS
jgi:hypothetical protein